jgi:dUTPase
MKLIIEKVGYGGPLSSGGFIPEKQNEDDAAFDCRVSHTKEIHAPNEGCKRVKVGLGFKVQVPKGFKLCMVPRSSIGKTSWILSNSFGIIDCNYSDEVFAVFETFDTNGNSNPFPFGYGDRCCQCFLQEVVPTEIEIGIVKGSRSGFGSTGRK